MQSSMERKWDRMGLWTIFIGLAIAIALAGLLASGGGDAGEVEGEGEGLSKATFAGGCFWCMEHVFDGLKGVISTTVGYTGGHKEGPTYQEVCEGGTGHAEAIEILFDPKQVTYSELLTVFWRNIDPTVKDRQFCDYGSQYRTAIFYHDEGQRLLAERSKQELMHSGRFTQLFTEILPASRFYPAEEYHQDYYKKNPLRYKLYHMGCGREGRLEELWGK